PISEHSSPMILSSFFSTVFSHIPFTSFKANNPFSRTSIISIPFLISNSAFNNESISINTHPHGSSKRYEPKNKLNFLTLYTELSYQSFNKHDFTNKGLSFYTHTTMKNF